MLRLNQAIKSVDSDIFELSMVEEIEKMWYNEVYDIIKKEDVRPGHSILISV